MSYVRNDLKKHKQINIRKKIIKILLGFLINKILNNLIENNIN